MSQETEQSVKWSPGVKHLIRCRCILSQFRNVKDPPLHEFAVFSVIDADDKVIPKYAQCNNCGIIHRVVDICKSEIIHNKESSPAIVSIDDIKNSLPPALAIVLRDADADIATWEAAQFVVENKRWGEIVVLSTDVTGDFKAGKYVRILGEQLYKVETFERREVTE